MYPDLECVGWYSSTSATDISKVTAALKGADKPTPQDLEFHKGPIARLTGDPLMLMMNPHSAAAKDKKKTPLFLFETSKPEGQFK